MMSTWEGTLQDLVDVVRRDPSNAEAQAALDTWISTDTAKFKAWIGAEALQFCTTPARVDRRLQFLKHLLLHGYLPPRVEEDSGSRWQAASINLAVVTSYFYANCLSLLEAGLVDPRVAIFVAQSNSFFDRPWTELVSRREGTGVRVWAALMLDAKGLVWRNFTQPVPVHYLFPVDNYYKSKFRLIAEYATSGVPMPGSVVIRAVCENKILLEQIAGSIPGLRLARELRLSDQGDEQIWTSGVDRFCVEHKLEAVVTKPIDGFGGSGVEFWQYPADRDALRVRLAQVLPLWKELLVQERINPVPLRSGRDWNVRQYVLRKADAIMAPWKRVRAGHGAVNTTQGAASMTVEQLLAEIKLVGAERRSFIATLQKTDELAVEVLRALEEYLKRRWGANERPYTGSGSNLEPDLLALDFMIGPDPEHAGQWAVYLNEINDFASGGMRDYEVLAHRQAFPEADSIRAIHPFSLAPRILDLARWRGDAYKAASG